MTTALLALVLAASPAASALQAHGIAVRASEGVASEALVEELAAGLLALPPAFRKSPGGTLTLECDPRPSPFGMGDGTPARPLWREGRFILYAYQEPDDPRAQARLAALDPSQRERLWRRRAMVHALVSQWDQRLRWSARKGWERITGWKGADRTNPYEWAYSRELGMQSPSLDLATFAEEALAPAESMDPGSVPLDDQVRCQEFSKIRFLRERLGPAPALATRSAECPAFSRWADLAHLAGVDLLLSAPSGQKLQSLFGHLMLRPVYSNPPGETRRTDPVVEVAALTAPGEPVPLFVARGIAGGYLNAFGAITPGVVRSEHVDREERNVRAWSLDLSSQERERVMERLWEAERRGYYPYRFFTDNCASYAGFILNGAVDEARMADLPWPLSLPTAVVDAFSPQRRPSAFISHRSAAMAAEARQDRLLAALEAAVPSQARAWRDFAEDARGPAVQERYAAYQRLPALAERTVRADSATAPLVMGMAEASLLMERYAAQALRQRMDEIDLSRIVFPRDVHLPTTEELVAERQRRFQRESGTDRLHETLARSLKWAGFLESLPRREATQEERSTAERAALTVDTFLTLTALYADLQDRYGAAPRWVPEETAPFPRQRSGFGRLAAGVAVQGGAGASVAAVVVRTAFGAERLGERRADGLDPLAEIVLMESELRLRPGPGLPAFAGMDVTVARLRSMPREPSLTRAHWYSGLGLGAGLVSAVSAQGRQRHTLWGEALLPLLRASEYQHHLVFGAGPAVQASGAGWLPTESAAGGRFELSARAQLSNAVPTSARASVTWTPTWRWLGSERVWIQEAKVSGTFEWARSARSPVQVELQAQAGWQWTAAGALERTVGAQLLLGTP